MANFAVETIKAVFFTVLGGIVVYVLAIGGSGPRSRLELLEIGSEREVNAVETFIEGNLGRVAYFDLWLGDLGERGSRELVERCIEAPPEPEGAPPKPGESDKTTCIDFNAAICDDADEDCSFGNLWFTVTVEAVTDPLERSKGGYRLHGCFMIQEAYELAQGVHYTLVPLPPEHERCLRKNWLDDVWARFVS